MRNEINAILKQMDKENPGSVDKLSSKEVSEIHEIKLLLKGRKITNFRVKRDNETHRLNKGTINIGENKLIGFNFDIDFF